MFVARFGRKTAAAMACLTLFSLTACVPSTGANGESEPVTLRLAYVMAVGDPMDTGANEFKKLVAERTDGRVNIELFPAGQLGGQPELTDALQEGSIDMVLGTPPLTKIKALQVSVAPMAFDTGKDMVRAFRSDVAEKFMWKPMKEQLGLINLDLWFSGANNFTSNVPFSDPASIAGVKVRVPEIDSSIDMIAAMGGSPQAISFPELYTALQTGTVDSQYNPMSRILASNFDEVQKYLIPAAVSMNASSFDITDAALNRLSPEDQEALRAAAHEAGDRVLTAVTAADEKLVAEAADTFEVIQPDKEAFRQAVLAKWLPKWDPIIGTGVYDAMVKASKEG